jgi:hypothetical protein
MDKRERFKSCAGLALAKLEEAHPERVHLWPSKLASELGEERNQESTRFCELTLEWLEENGYIRCGNKIADPQYGVGQHVFREARLTDKGFGALEVKIEFRGKKERVGEALVQQLGATAGEMRNAAIAELMGYFLGGIAKSWSLGS